MSPMNGRTVNRAHLSCGVLHVQLAGALGSVSTTKATNLALKTRLVTSGLAIRWPICHFDSLDSGLAQDPNPRGGDVSHQADHPVTRPLLIGARPGF